MINYINLYKFYKMNQIMNFFNIKNNKKILYPRNNDELKNIILKYKNISIKGQYRESKEGAYLVDLSYFENKIIINKNSITVSVNKTPTEIDYILSKNNIYIKKKWSVSYNRLDWFYQLINIIKSITIMNLQGFIQKICKDDALFNCILGSELYKLSKLSKLFGVILEVELETKETMTNGIIDLDKYLPENENKL